MCVCHVCPQRWGDTTEAAQGSGVLLPIHWRTGRGGNAPRLRRPVPFSPPAGGGLNSGSCEGGEPMKWGTRALA